MISTLLSMPTLGLPWGLKPGTRGPEQPQGQTVPEGPPNLSLIIQMENLKHQRDGQGHRAKQPSWPPGQYSVPSVYRTWLQGCP